MFFKNQKMSSFRQKIKEETSHVLKNAAFQKSDTLTEKEIIHLPAPIQKWLKISGAVGKEKTRTVALKQSFLMKLKPFGFHPEWQVRTFHGRSWMHTRPKQL